MRPPPVGRTLLFLLNGENLLARESVQPLRHSRVNRIDVGTGCLDENVLRQ